MKYIFYKVLEKIKTKIVLNKNIKAIVNEMNNDDVIIFGRVFIALIFLPIMKKKKLTSKVVVRDAIHLEFFDKKVKKNMLKYFPTMVNKFIVSSDESIEAYKKFFKVDSINMEKIYNPLGIIPNHKFNFGAKTVVSIGRFDTQKGFENLIKAFDRVHNKHKDWVLKLYGNGDCEYKRLLEDTIEALIAKDYVKILPPTKNVVEVFNNSSIFVLPSRYEGYANILVEAMACGMPCISFDWYMGVEEIKKDTQNGLIAYLEDRQKYFKGEQTEKDINSLKEKMENLIENESYSAKLSKEATKIAETRNIDIIIDKWINIIK